MTATMISGVTCEECCRRLGLLDGERVDPSEQYEVDGPMLRADRHGCAVFHDYVIGVDTTLCEAWPQGS